MTDELELFQFRYSHYNEKVRWALDYKGLPHTRTDLLPGPHLGVIKKLTGQHQTPVLRINSQYVHDSAWIIERLELLYADAPRLFPADTADRDRAQEIARHFDFVVGPAARACVFVAMLDEPDYVARLFSTGQPPLRRTLYRAALPLLKSRIKKANDIVDSSAIKRANRLVVENMESLRKLTFKRRYLAGDAFSVADLTAASMLAILVDPPHPDMQRPEPMPKPLAELTQKWRDHPAGRWALEIYERHRPVVSRALSVNPS
jgi:glutathione S-transferase